jgi:CheY-like chemotaxis protein
MSHDLRSPLNSVVTLSQLLAEGNAGPLSVDQRGYVDVIRHSGQTLLALITDILDLAAVESGRVEIEVGLVDLSALARSVAEGAAPAANEKGIPVQVNVPAEALVSEVDGEHLRQILQRLVEHAIAETRNGYVEIAVRRSADRRRAQLHVHETAPTLTDAARRALSEDRDDFDDYIAGEGSFAERGPAALPLVVAARLARLMGLRITVESSNTDGISFDLELALASGDQAARAAEASPPKAELALVAGPASGHVLLVEDDFIERQRVRTLLESAGYEVTLAGSGEDGLALLRTTRFDAVVLDLVMPGMSGLDVLRVARLEERLADLPFIVLSALYMTKSERAVLGPGVTSVVRKGADTAEELTLALRRAIKASSAEAPAASAPGGDGSPHA